MRTYVVLTIVASLFLTSCNRYDFKDDYFESQNAMLDALDAVENAISELENAQGLASDAESFANDYECEDAADSAGAAYSAIDDALYALMDAQSELESGID